MADENEEKPAGDSSAEETAESPSPEPARETAVGHQVVEADAAAAKPDEGTTEVFFSRDEPAAAGAGAPQPAAAPSTPPSGTSPAAADRQAADSHDQFEQKPELYIAGAFVGAFVLGKLLKKLTGRD